nr:SAHS [Macrobiotus sp. 4 JF-2023a]
MPANLTAAQVLPLFFTDHNKDDLDVNAKVFHEITKQDGDRFLHKISEPSKNYHNEFHFKLNEEGQHTHNGTEFKAGFYFILGSSFVSTVSVFVSL